MIKNTKDSEFECAKNTEQEEITLNILEEIHPDKNLGVTSRKILDMNIF